MLLWYICDTPLVTKTCVRYRTDIGIIIADADVGQQFSVNRATGMGS